MDILIWGWNDFSRKLIHFLSDTTIHVKGIIIENGENLATPLNTYHPEEIRDNPSLTNLPIIIAIPHIMIFGLPVLRIKYMQQFKEKIQEIKKEYQLPNQLLHPAALVDFLSLNFKKKIILFGLQGSGNVIFNHLIHDIQKYFFPFFAWRNKKSLFFELLCREYMQLTYQVVTEAIHLQDGFDIRAVTWKVGTSHFNCKLSHHDASVYDFTTREHIALTAPLYHQLPSQSFIEKLIESQFKLFFVARNPLDLLLSGLNKSHAVDPQARSIDNELFEATALWITDQLRAWAPQLPSFQILKYEELIENPIPTICTLMKKLNVPSIKWLARKLWRHHGFKQLPNTFKSHFWKGGTGKWEDYFSTDHLLFLKACGIEEILSHYDYPKILSRFQQLTADVSSEKLAALQAQIARRHRCCYGDETIDTFEFLIKQHGAPRCRQKKSFIFMSYNHEARECLEKIFDNPYLEAINQAGKIKYFPAQ